MNSFIERAEEVIMENEIKKHVCIGALLITCGVGTIGFLINGLVGAIGGVSICAVIGGIVVLIMTPHSKKYRN